MEDHGAAAAQVQRPEGPDVHGDLRLGGRRDAGGRTGFDRQLVGSAVGGAGGVVDADHQTAVGLVGAGIEGGGNVQDPQPQRVVDRPLHPPPVGDLPDQRVVDRLSPRPTLGNRSMLAR